MTDARTPHATHTDGPVPRWRLSRPGRPASGIAVWAARLPALALLGGIALVTGAVVWPLARPAPSDPIVPQDAPRISLGRLPVADRERALASLTAKNLFAVDGRFWSAPAPVVTEADAATDGGSPDGSTPGTAPNAPGAPPIVLTNAAEMPPDIKSAFENLRLIGVRRAASGPPIALIALVSDLTTVREHRLGSEFVDDKFAQARWRIAAIDIARDRVELERTGKRVSLALYPAEPLPVPPAPEAATPEPTAVVTIVSATPDEVARELRDAGITDAEIAELMRMMREDPAAFAAARAAADAKTDKKSEPEGLGAVLELMRSATEKKDDAPPPVDPPGV